jgi:outer membrane protein OmpA-like peptidoglycan-associated protein
VRKSGVRWREPVLLVRATPLLAACAAAPQAGPQQPIGLTHAPAPVRATEPGAASRETALARHARAPAPEAVSTGAPAAPGRLCGVPDTAVEALLFTTNDAALRARETQILDDVVACFHAGLYRGQRLVLTGYADQRGRAAYNRELALRRARSVQRYLVRRGVPADGMDVCSAGESETRGTGAENWIYDRRVEIALRPARRASESGTCNGLSRASPGLR